MSRVLTPFGGDSRDAVRREVRQEVGRALPQTRKRGRNVTLLVLIGLALVVLWGLARAGVVQVPLLSPGAYEAAPVRAVRPLVGSTAAQVSQTVAASVQFSPNAGTAAVVLDEAQLTTLVADAASRQAGANMVDVQVAVTPTFIELFANRVREDGSKVPMRLRAVPSSLNNELQLEVIEALMGSVEVPAWMRRTLGSGAVAAFERSISGLGASADVEDVVLQDGVLRIVLRPRR
jgi:hypothetical protein